MSLLLLCICQGPASVFQSSGSYQHVKRGVLSDHESSACSLWTPALSGIQKGLGSWGVHSQSSIWMPPLPVSPHDPVLLYASTHSASVPVFLTLVWSLQLLSVLFPSLDWALCLCRDPGWYLCVRSCPRCCADSGSGHFSTGWQWGKVCFSNRCQDGFLESSKLRFSTLNI